MKMNEIIIGEYTLYKRYAYKGRYDFPGFLENAVLDVDGIIDLFGFVEAKYYRFRHGKLTDELLVSMAYRGEEVLINYYEEGKIALHRVFKDFNLGWFERSFVECDKDGELLVKEYPAFKALLGRLKKRGYEINHFSPITLYVEEYSFVEVIVGFDSIEDYSALELMKWTYNNEILTEGDILCQNGHSPIAKINEATHSFSIILPFLEDFMDLVDERVTGIKRHSLIQF